MSRRSSQAPANAADALERVRGWIVRGEIAPGERLPTRQRLEAEFGLSHMTMQRVLNALAEDGFVRSRGRAGTEVVEHPPHRTRFGIAFGEPRGEGRPRSRYYAALERAIRAKEAEGPLRFPVYDGLDGHEDVEDLERLIADCHARRLGGLFLPHAEHELREILAREGVDVPMVSFSERGGPERLPVVRYRRRELVERAVATLGARGAARIAVLHRADDERQRRAGSFERAVAESGAVTDPAWQLYLPPFGRKAIRHTVRLLFRARPEERPDGLILTDDHLIAETIEGVRSLGLEVPRDVAVVAHANFPLSPAESREPVRHLGFDMKAALEAGAVLARARAADEGPDQFDLEARFPEEPAPAVPAMTDEGAGTAS